MANEEVTMEAIEAALTKLSNEVLGSLPLMEVLARREFGNTNYNILIQRADEARALLADSQSRPTKGADITREILRETIGNRLTPRTWATTDDCGTYYFVNGLDDAVDAVLALITKEAAPSLQKRPVAFRAKDALDQWILFDNEDDAADTGFEYQGLYARDDKSPAADRGQIVAGPTIEEKYRHLRDNAEAFVEGMKVMVAALERDGKTDEATNLKVWCLMSWEAAIRDDDSGDLWPLCEACGEPIKNQAETVAGEDCEFHTACADPAISPAPAQTEE